MIRFLDSIPWFDSLSKAETFKKYYSLLAENFDLKLPNPPNNFGMELVNNWYKKYSLKKKLIFAKIQSGKMFRVPKNFDKAKASGIDEISGIFAKDFAKLLTTPITQLYNLLISSKTFLDAC